MRQPATDIPWTHARDANDVVSAYEQAVRDMARLNRIQALLADDAPVPALADRLVLTLSELFAADVVALLDAPERGLGRLADIGLPQHDPPRPFTTTEESHAWLAARTRAPVAVTHAAGDRLLEPLLAELGVESLVWVPVLGSQHVQALVVLARCHPLPFERADADLLMAIASRIGLVLERARANNERRLLDERLRQAEKAESLGRMAAAIAHRFNNLFAVVIGNLELALGDLPAEAGRPEVRAALAAARQAAGVSGSMLTYLGQGVSQLEVVDLVEASRATLGALAPALPAGVRLTTDLPALALRAQASPDAVGQIVTQLVVNAWEAMGESGGHIAVRLRSVDRYEVETSPFPMPGFRPTAARYACLEVSDSGRGMMPAELKDAFDPFYSTKFPGRGLGLPVVLGLVRAHGGLVAVESALGRGTRLRVYLPLDTQATVEVAAPAPRHEAAHGLALVAEDEPVARAVVERLLRKVGYGVLAVADGVEALAAFEAHAAEIRFAVLDVTMPRLGGWKTLERLRERSPGLPVIFTSGYDEERVMREALTERPQAFLHKPFGGSDLVAAVERILATKP